MGSEPLAELELLVMLAALRLGPNEAYTVSIVEDIRGRTGRSVRRANVFTALRRLEEKGLVSTRLGDPRPERGGRPPRLVATYTRERPGLSAFALADGVVHHTYSAYSRGVDGVWGMYQWLDRAPLGRNEGKPWWRRHDEYGGG